MAGALREPVIVLVGGPWDRQAFYVSDWDDRRQAAQRMRRVPDELCGYALAYRPETSGSLRWIWTAGDGWPTNACSPGDLRSTSGGGALPQSSVLGDSGRDRQP
jgi:hypothetical protein